MRASPIDASSVMAIWQQKEFTILLRTVYRATTVDISSVKRDEKNYFVAYAAKGVKCQIAWSLRAFFGS